LEFRPGVTVVVGPNGSGKSNLVDALSWVMGTQSTKSLRTGKMEDVVFAGTATRPALNRAEATLIIDNAERMLPLDLDEVALTRRLYRDGSSDYEINGVGCRLLDVQELLSDSGVGRHQHVIIGQGQVDEVLNASPEDHRAVIEEAAGILKHRRRKEKAERRLERTDEDVLRLQDLVGEIERQLRPLRRQARAAERYHGLKSEVRDLSLYLAGIAIDAYETEMDAGSVTLETLTGQIASDESELGVLTASVEALTARASTVGVGLDRDTGAAARLETTVERLRRLGAVAQERSRAVSGRRQAGIERRSDLRSELGGIVDELVGVTASETEATSHAEAMEARFRRLEDEERAIATQNALSPEGALAAVRGELSVFQAAGVRDSREVESIDRRLAVVDSQLGDESGEISRINDEIRALDEDVSGFQQGYQKANRRREIDQKAWSGAEEAITEARLAVAATEARVDALEAALSGSFDIESRRKVETVDGALGALVSRLDIPAGLEKAVDAALGRWADAVAFQSVDRLKEAVETVKAAGGGGVPVVSAVNRGSAPASEIAAASGVDALVDRLGPRADLGLARHLLGDVLLVEGWATALALVARHPALRAVTPEGDLVSIDGVQIAQPDGAGPAMVEMARMMAEQAKTQLSRASSIHTAAKRDFEKSRDLERAALEQLESAEAALAGRAEAMGRLQKSVDALEGERARLKERLGSIEEGAAERKRQIAELTGRLEALEGEEAGRMKVWEELEGRRIQIAADREIARSEWQEATSVQGVISERRRLLEERGARIEADLARVDGEEPAPIAVERLDLVDRYARDAVEILQGRLATLRERQAGLRAENEGTVMELSQARSRMEERRTSAAAARERLATLQVRLTELRLLKESVIESVRRDADSDADAARGALRPDYPDDADLPAILEERSAQLRRLGPINPLAADEFAELDERHTFLVDQLADVESSRSELRKVIRALEDEIELRFQEAFTEVAEAYQRYFTVLFPGGRGRIRLADADDAHSGLMIEAQPLGKKVSQLTLLSGGERSLAALAFLFSIFEARPSPFYVLDEVEAALDDANLRRFLRIVDEFRQRAQLLIVTHQQQTMEAADVLYGVTMEPGGSSQVVRKDMTSVGVDLVV
ncbi:MAG TPA: chromosome segregation protein SMC, partial [Acidimicrobiia bacterium]|nr:chromosome segregation protein SMC [Acidimicrobiia bacterium]